MVSFIPLLSLFVLEICSILICNYCHFTAVVLFGEPIRWETNLQLITDVLLTNGRPGNPVTSLHYPHIPCWPATWICCGWPKQKPSVSVRKIFYLMAKWWLNLALNDKITRTDVCLSLDLDTACFLVCLESIYKKITGCELKYEGLIGKPSVVTYNYAELLIRKQAEKLGWTRPVERLYAIGSVNDLMF